MQPGDIAIDATCGAGYDSSVLASLDLSCLHIFDIQKAALDLTKERLGNFPQKFKFYELCHSKISEAAKSGTVKLVVYNLGYLPGSDKTIKTLPETTLKSLQCALDLIAPGGAISITCYPGHLEGALEETALLSFCRTLSPKEWRVCFHQFLNRQASPSLILIQRATSSL